jgi:hypothetical protein
VGERAVEIGPGTPVLIPRRVVHAFKNAGPEPAVALVVFTPAFDGKDRFSPQPGESEANLRLRELALAFAAREIDALAALLAEPAAKGASFGPAERAKLATEIDALRGDPLQRSIPEAIAAFPALGSLPAGAVNFTAHVSVDASGTPLVVKVNFRKVGDRWLVGNVRLESPSGVLPKTARLERADTTDLREVLRAAAERNPALAAAAAEMPSVSGLWPETTSVMLLWGTRERPVRVEFRKAGGEWGVER